jgi:predicted O-methyltransferase YrrM
MLTLDAKNEEIAVDLAHNALLLGAVTAFKPERVLELGVGTGFTMGAVLQALSYNQCGHLTAVDNWLDFGGVEPPHVQQLRDAGAGIVTSDEETFVKRCPANSYDLLISDADHLRSDQWFDDHLRIVRPDGLLFFHDTTNPAFPNLATILTEVQRRGLHHVHFNKSTRPDERCERGWLMVVNRKARGAVVSVWDHAMKDVAAITAPVMEEYCRRQGYAWLGQQLPYWNPWVKPEAIKDALGSYDWVCWLDADCLIMDQGYRIERFLHPTAELITSRDANGLNNGVMLVKNTDWTRGFVQKWRDQGPRFAGHPSADQTALASFLFLEPKEKWVCLGQTAMNSYLYELYPGLECPEGQYRKGDFILHLPALTNGRRIEIFKSVLASQST